MLGPAKRTQRAGSRGKRNGHKKKTLGKYDLNSFGHSSRAGPPTGAATQAMWSVRLLAASALINCVAVAQTQTGSPAASPPWGLLSQLWLVGMHSRSVTRGVRGYVDRHVCNVTAMNAVRSDAAVTCCRRRRLYVLRRHPERLG